MIKPKENVHLMDIIIKTYDRMFHISREHLKQLSFTKLEVIQRKVKCVFQADEFLQKLLTEDMNAALPKVYMKPQGITYKVRNRVGYFILKDHPTPQNRSQIISLIQEIRRKGSLNKDEREIVQILQSYISSLSSLNGDVKVKCYSLFVNTRTQLNLNKIVISKQS